MKGVILVLYIWAAVLLGRTNGNAVYFQPGREYRFDYSGTSLLNDVGTFSVKAKIGISQLGVEDVGTQNCLLRLYYYHVRVHQEPDIDKDAYMGNVDFTNWLSFDMDIHGHIDSVFYDSNSDDLYAVEVKKKILGVLSNKLMISETAESNGTRWAYGATEYGQEGKHSTSYQAEPDPSSHKIVFQKKKLTKTLDSLDQSYDKVVHLDRASGIPHYSEISEEFATSGTPSYTSSVRGTEEEINQIDSEYGFPVMKGKGQVSLMFDREVESSVSDELLLEKPHNLFADTLQARHVPEAVHNRTEAMRFISGNITCMLHTASINDQESKMPCFRELCVTMSRTSFEDLQFIVSTYRTSNQTVWPYIVDALGATHTNDSLLLLTNQVLASDQESFNITMAALAQVIALDKCPPQELPRLILRRVLDQPWQYEDEHNTQLVNDRALLVLGGLANTMRMCNITWADDVTRLLQKMTRIHDPYNHRVSRSVMSASEFKRHVARTSLHLLALSNDAHPSSYKYFKSYVNDTESHIQLRCNAIHGINEYHNLQAAETLLSAALTDTDVSVRYRAADAYTTHPYGGDIRNFLASEQFRYSNITDVEHVRMRRSLQDIASRIWKGFEFHLSTPSFDWQKVVGGRMLGASMGVIIENFLDVNIGPLAGYAAVNIYDKAWAIAHLGIIGLDYTFFLADICYKGRIDYDLNAIAEYNFEEAFKLAELIDGVINEVVQRVQTAIRNFKNLLTTIDGFDIGDIIDNFITALKDMPKNVFNLRKIGRRLIKVMDEFTALPEVFYQIRDFVRRVTTIFNDVKTDVMTLYNAIMDTVKTTLPWAWREIKSAFNGMVDAVRNILRNPMTSIQNLGRGVARISIAVGVILDAKDTILDANIFAKDNRPYWFDFVSLFESLWDDVGEIGDSLEDAFDWLRGEENTDVEAYTGVAIADLKKQILQELWNHVMEEMMAPFEHLRRILEPFVATYTFITDTIKTVKEAWTFLVQSYNEARSLFESVFGPKFHEEFPRQYLTSSVCGDGFWESKGKDHYDNPGIDLVVQIGHGVVAPFGGDIRKTGPKQITIKPSSMKDLEVIIDNIAFHTNITNPEVGAGDYIGTALRPWCSTGHIHVSMKDLTSNKFVDPARFKRKRKMPPPRWIEECDHYKLVWRNRVVSSGSITRDPELQDDTPPLNNAPDPAELESEGFTESTSTRRKRSVGEWIDRFQNFTRSLGFGDFSDLKELFTIRLDNMTISRILGFLGQNGYSDLENTLNKAFEKIQELGNHETCTRPESLDDNELRAIMIQRGLSTTGSRGTLEQRYRSPATECYDLSNHVAQKTICNFEDNCLGISCCVDFALFGLFRYSVMAYIKYDPCETSLVLGVDSWSTVIPVPTIAQFQDVVDSDVLEFDIGDLNVVQLIVHYKISFVDNKFKVDVSLAVCSSLKEECTDVLHITEGLRIPHFPCTASTNSTQSATATGLSLDTSVNVRELISVLDIAGLSEDEIFDIIDQIREAFALWLEEQIQSVITRIFDNVLDHQEMCMTGFPLAFGPHEVVIYRSPDIVIPLGWFDLVFRFGLNGYYGANFHCTLCIMSMKAGATVTPYVGAIAWGSMGLRIGPFQIQLRLTGHLLTTEFPTKVDVYFQKFPIDVKSRMDLRLTPLRIVLYGEIIFEIRFSIWGKRITFRKTIISVKLWEYQSRTINKVIFNVNDAEPDNSPPTFLEFDVDSGSIVGAVDNDNEDESGESKRSISNRVSCTVEQIIGKDYTEPAFNIQYDVADDRSDVETTLCIGTYRAGCDVLRDEPLAGTASLQSRGLYSGAPLYFTVTSRNSQGEGASITCDLPTYDVTLPTGRVNAEFRSTSHPHIVRCLMFVTDDSEIVTQQVSAGYGDTSFGTQLIPWESFTTARDTRTGTHSSNSAGTHYLTFYSVPKIGRLVYPPFETHTFQYAFRCAEECERHPLSKCLGFNYDYGPSDVCELLNSVEGDATVQMSGNFHYFERLGIGHTGQLDRNDLDLPHNSLLYCNVYLQNRVGYENHMISEGIVVDFTPPDPGPQIVIVVDTLLIEDCTTYTPAHFDLRCSEQTPLPNYRVITDEPYSECTVCNGHTPGEELYWTRANRMVSAHWDHIHDNETGILIYTWGVGTEPCEDTIHPHTDPHAHIHQESEWTHEGVAFPLDLQDGAYHATVTALNKVDFGGPLALRICHTTPYIIDTTPPVIYYVEQAEYSEYTYDITMNVTAGDDLSGIQYQEIGLGRSRRDTYIVLFTPVPQINPLFFNYQLPDGIPIWVRVRVANNVDLRSMDHSPRALFLDSSAPLAGELYMGRRRGVHERYQYQSSQLCVNWQDFYDPQSGISTFQLAFGTSPGSIDIMDYIDLPHTEYEYCQDGLSLEHNTYYYAGFVAINGASHARNVSAVSAGILVDFTAPHSGSVKDGPPDTHDIRYSSNPATVAVTWYDFYDPESGLEDIEVSFIKTGDNGDHIVLHLEDNVASIATNLEFHHFHLHHRDVVHIEVNATNGAGLSTVNASDGFLVDLTDPVMHSLVDGDEANNDKDFSSSTNAMSVSWHFVDEDSGIAAYKTAIFTIYAGLRHQIYPESSNSWITLGATETGWNTGDILNLIPGRFYFTRVTAINGAGLTAVHDTDGVIVDSTPPEMTYVHAGVLAGESEEVIDGYVYQNDPHGFRASWRASDHESGITAYFVAVGTQPGQDDIMLFTEFLVEDAYLGGLSLDLTDTNLDQPAPLYYVTVKAISGAAQYSDVMISSPIILLEEDQDGVVWDGLGASITADIDYQLNTQSASISFSGFESALHGIERYEWAVGTLPRYDDVMPFTDYGIIVIDERTTGLGSAGYATIILPLEHGHKYYATVRAITGAGNVMDVSADGVTIDTTPATTSIVMLRGISDASLEEMVYQKEETMEAKWSSADVEGYVANTVVSVGTVPGADDVYSAVTTNDNHLPPDVSPTLQGQPNYITVLTENQVGLTSSVTSPPIIIDNTAPSEGRVVCPVFATGNTIECSLWGFVDNESGIERFEVALGVSEGDGSISGFTPIASGSDDFSIAFDSLNNFGETAVYYVTVKALNNAELDTVVFSNAVFIDNSPPVGGSVIEVADYELFDVQTSTRISPNTESLSTTDATCQRDVTRVHIAWDTFTDEQTGIDHYDIALGTAPGGTQIVSFITVDATQTDHVFTDLNLARIPTVYATVRGYNKAGLHTTLVSNGVHISKLSAGLHPLQPLVVYDGGDIEDLDFQNHIDGLGASWFLTGDPCPMQSMTWTIMRFDNIVINPEEQLPTVFDNPDQAYAFLDEIPLHDRESFYVKISATNELNYTLNLHSDGVTIKLEPVLPGTVRDGVILGTDLSYQLSNSSLGCHWNGFGQYREDGTFDSLVEDTVDGVDIEVGEHQTIHHYEVAIGTDRTTHQSRTDIRPFTNVYRNESWVFPDLNLQSTTSIYYCTVRAYSISRASAEVTSNGIRVGYGGTVLQHGSIILHSYIPSLTSIYLSWSGFEFSTPVLRYYWGIASGNQITQDYDCDDIILNWRESDSIANVYPFQDAALDTYVTPVDLALVHASMYTVLVIAVDQSGTCDLALQAFTVDNTHPVAGTIQLQNSVEMDVLYNDALDSIHVVWSGFSDSESGIETFDIELYSAYDCNPDISRNDSLALIASDTLPTNSTAYKFMELDLQYDTRYFIILRVQNGAKLTTTALSRPVLVDMVNPISGKVMDGHSYLSDIEFQSSTSEVSGTFLYIPSHEVTCLHTVYSSFTDHNHLSTIVHKGLCLFPNGKQNNIHFMNPQVLYSRNSITLRMQRKVVDEIFKSGAIHLDTEIVASGVYKFELRAPDEEWGVTSIAFWDGHPGIMVTPSNVTSPSAEQHEGITIIPQAFDDDTYPEGYRLASAIGNGFGCKIRVLDVNGERQTEVTLWGETEGALRQSSVLLGFDGSAGFHTYDLSVNEDRDVADMRDWDLKLYVNGALAAALGGIEGIYRNGSILVGLYNHDGFMPDVSNDFAPDTATPSTYTVINSIVLPPSNDITCNPFMGGDHPIAEFYAGIGTDVGETDIVPFHRVHIPDIPCTSLCDEDFCNPSTNQTEVQIIQFTLSNLTLAPSSEEVMPIHYTFSNLTGVQGVDVTAVNETMVMQQPYFVTVKALTGSGRAAIASSNGFYIDTTPPVIHSILHFDTVYDSNEPVRFQGNNYSIRVVFGVEDMSSGVIENWWAIGTAPYSTDIQGFVSVGTDELAFNNDLGHLLQNNHTYYVTIKSENAASLVSYNSSTGVTVLLDSPSVENTTTLLPGTTQIGSDSTNAVSSTSQTNFTVQFDTPPSSENIVDIEVSAGTAPGQRDIFPQQQVGYNVSGEVSITGSGLAVNNDSYQNLTASRGRNSLYGDDGDDTGQPLRKKRSTDEYTQLRIDPGRPVFINIDICNPAHLCSTLPTKAIMVVRDSDTMTSPDVNGQIITELEAQMFDQSETTIFSISTTARQTSDTYLITGYLSEDDVTEEYKSDASETFQPMVVDPVVTIDQTDRNLRNRVRSISSREIFITALPAQPVSGPITVSFNFNRTEYLTASATTEPRLIAYCPTQQVWVDAGESCSGGNGSRVYWSESRAEVTVCNLEAYCEASTDTQRRYRRQADNSSDISDDFSDSNTFAVAAVDTEYENQPPILTSVQNIEMTEDQGVIITQLTAADPELDEFEFFISETDQSRGEVSLTTNGELSYTPCEDCFGLDMIPITIREVRADAIEVLESNATINITINPINDNPRLVIMKNGASLNDDEYQVLLTMEQYADGNEDYHTPLQILIGAYDVDEDTVNIYFGTVDSGDILVQNQVETGQYDEQNCSLSWQRRKSAWRDFEDDVRYGDRVTVLVPCDMAEIVTGKALQWTLSLIKYEPQVDFYGADNIRVSARDNSASRLPSELMNITIYVLANPCMNDATCKGPDADPDCTSLDRANGFDGYRCRCLKGFEGEICETNTDDCEPNKCKYGYKCVDKVAGYECECVHGPCLLEPWMSALIAITCIAVVAVVVVIFACLFYVRKKQRDSDTQKLIGNSQADISEFGSGKAYPEEEDLQYMPDAQAPITTDMSYWPKHDVAEGPEGSGQEPLPWAKVSQDAPHGSKTANPYELKPNGPVFWNEGRLMPKQPPMQPISARMIQVDSEVDLLPDITTTTAFQKDQDRIKLDAHDAGAHDDDNYDEEYCDDDNNKSDDESTNDDTDAEDDTDDESTHDDDTGDEDTEEGSDDDDTDDANGAESNRGENTGETADAEIANQVEKVQGAKSRKRRPLTPRNAVAPLLSPGGNGSHIPVNQVAKMPVEQQITALKKIYTPKDVAAEEWLIDHKADRPKKRSKKTKAKKGTKTGDAKPEKPYVSRNPRPKKSPGPRSAWKKVWRNGEPVVDVQVEAKQQLAWNAPNEPSDSREVQTPVQMLQLRDEQEIAMAKDGVEHDHGIENSTIHSEQPSTPGTPLSTRSKTDNIDTFAGLYPKHDESLC